MNSNKKIADANLVATAPEMLEALEECVRHLGEAVARHSMPKEASEAWRKADEVIAKAKGGAS